MKASALSQPGRVGLNVSAVFFGIFGAVTTLLSVAPGAPAPLSILLRTAAVVLIVAAVGVGTDKTWGTIPAIAAGALGVLAALVMMALVPVFIFPEALAVIAVVVLAGSSFALYAVLLNRRRQSVRRALIDELILLESRGFLITTALATLSAFVIIPGLGATVWSLFGCGGQISGGLCA
jgi:hypothetical protein